ncbi:peptidase S15 [Isoalcanivorax pacificus W11-5]|uniref:Peptidase S15 n=1 Tax=Isoalcanivorax pacificus W11-5 TaxID=391936 RepID=A0A0B4XP26_9GAMM|nr:CocE/NonD family hydrolase [Isoalcanivorax pacificus]AJD48238.1 peptidase S15 [Isoalcanivorax pacificus W11-5]
MRYALALLVVMLLGGCATTLPSVPPGPVSQPLEAHRYQVEIPTHDGLMLTATVYQPALASGDTAPVIIATHGFGGFRAKRPFSIYGKTMLTGQAAIAAWRQGYWVVFYDQRGFGGSDGKVHMMSPDHEVRDVSSVIDWTLAHLPAIRTLADGRPALGMIGESYGGGAQILGSIRDDRLAALVPIATWYDLADGFAPHDHVRSQWGAHLFTLGTFSSGFDFGMAVKKPFRSAFGGTLAPDARRMLRAHSPVSFCEQGQYPQADALLIQGFRDSLFGIEHAQANQACFEAGGREARLLAIQGGHILPWPTQRWSGKPLFNTEDTLTCNGEERPLVDMIVSWWDEKLRDGDTTVPAFCAALDYDTGMQLGGLPTQTDAFPLSSGAVNIPFAGLFEWLMVPFDVGSDIFRGFWPGRDLRQLRPNGGGGRPRFVPVYVAERDDELLLGTPEIDLRLSGSASRVSTRVFVGIGVQHAGKRRVQVASEQLTPLPAKGLYRESLPPVSVPLKAGDRVGLVVYGYSWQYAFNPSFWWSRAQLEGALRLPLQEGLEELPLPALSAATE